MHVIIKYIRIKSLSKPNNHEVHIVLLNQYKDNDLKVVQFNTHKVY
jgi:hypothetical protein